MRWIIVGVTTTLLIALGAGGVFAHKEKLPADALTLVRQASALLAQNPGMTGEVRERLEAALKSKKPEGVHLDQVALALRALEKRDVATARRLLLAAIMPAGMPMPPEGPRRPAARPTVTPAAAAPAPPPGVQLSVDVAMRMTEPLRVRFTGSRAETSVLTTGLGLVGLGLFLLGRSRMAQS